MNKRDRIAFVTLPAAIDHLLRASFHLRVVALHRGEVEIGVTTPCSARGRAATEADQHRWSTQHNQRVTGLHRALLYVFRADISQAARKHNRLVISEDGTVGRLLVSSEVSRQCRP